MYHGFSGYRVFLIFSFSTFDVVTIVGMDVLLKDRLSLDFLRHDFWAGSSINIDIDVVVVIQSIYYCRNGAELHIVFI